MDRSLVAARVMRAATLAKRSVDAATNEMATDVAGAEGAEGMEGMEGEPLVVLGQGEYRRVIHGKQGGGLA